MDGGKTRRRFCHPHSTSRRCSPSGSECKDGERPNLGNFGSESGRPARHCLGAYANPRWKILQWCSEDWRHGQRSTRGSARAPQLDRPIPKAWTRPEKLINGKDLTGWEPIASRRASRWIAKDGELVNTESGANLKTTRKFDDFKLHIEFNCPDHGNSGLYLRGRYEIQIGTEGGKLPNHEMGAIYGYQAPAKEVAPRPGEWQTYDVTLIGRHVTVIHNGVTIHDNQELEGITGGALDSAEEEPGPFFLQGDHQGLLRFRNMTISVPKR